MFLLDMHLLNFLMQKMQYKHTKKNIIWLLTADLLYLDLDEAREM